MGYPVNVCVCVVCKHKHIYTHTHTYAQLIIWSIFWNSVVVCVCGGEEINGNKHYLKWKTKIKTKRVGIYGGRRGEEREEKEKI